MTTSGPITVRMMRGAMLGGALMLICAVMMSAVPQAPPSKLSWAEVLEQLPDPKVVTDADLLKGIKATGLPWRVRDKATGIELLLVPPGKFVMGMSPGDKEADADERPAHEVTLSKAFYLGRTEVTQAEWAKMMKDNPSRFRGPGGETRDERIQKYIAEGLTKQEAEAKAGPDLPDTSGTANNPVEDVGWDDCQRYCGKTGMRLPSEAEWEYACRAGVRKSRYGELDAIAWFDQNSQRKTHPVGKKLANALGFQDMLGNVFEWCQDWYEGDYYKSCEDGVTDPTGPTQEVVTDPDGTRRNKYSYRVFRGGSWYINSSGCRASDRFFKTPVSAIYIIGFRVARTP